MDILVIARLQSAAVRAVRLNPGLFCKENFSAVDITELHATNPRIPCGLDLRLGILDSAEAYTLDHGKSTGL